MKQVILHDIRSHYNVGAIFRTSDGAGVSKIYLTGYTPAPEDRFGRQVAEISKTALGAEKFVAWEKNEDILAVVQKLKTEGVTVVAVEQSNNSVMLNDFVVPEKVAYMFGSETAGVPPEVLAEVDIILELPMLGQKESLNVSVTAGIVLFR
ncbi:MAG: TrmH family RNA methyltransferase [Candidatus Pacebacteria bacterium]|nr:TrmH family RNA methyltransferase [Candidatus Paceibacterota bacterium]